MSNKFLGESSVSLNSGSQEILGSTIGASNLLSGTTVKVNSQHQLTSSQILISDVQGLSTAISGKLANPSSVPITAPSFVKSGGTSSQYLMADGTVTTGGGVGATGPTGASGPAGLSSSVFTYTFSDQTSGTPPAGHLFLNNVPAEATSLVVNHLTKPNNDIDVLLENVQIGSKLVVQRSNNSNIYRNYQVTSRTLSVGYVTFGLGYLVHAGAIANDDEVLLITQAQGIQGIQGVTGPTGAQGPAGGTVANPPSDVWNVKAVSYHTIGGFFTGVGSGWLGNRGGSSTLESPATTSVRTRRFRHRQPTSSVANGQDSGWYSTTGVDVNLPLYLKQGFKAIFRFGLGDTSTNASTRTFVGLWSQTVSASVPLFDSTTTIQSYANQCVGLIQEAGESTWSFYTKGASGGTKSVTSVSCTTPSTTWFNFEIYNPPGADYTILTLIDQEAMTSTTLTFAPADAFSVNTTTALYFLCTRAMSSAGGITGSAILESDGFKLLTC